jgi:hypothetical protein
MVVVVGKVVVVVVVVNVVVVVTMPVFFVNVVLGDNRCYRKYSWHFF